jgi:hypothetical protein
MARLAAAASALLLTLSAAAESPVGDFRLLDQNGISRELYRDSDRRAIAIVSADEGCAAFRASIPELRELKRRLDSRGVDFLLLDSDPRADREDVRSRAAQDGLDVPVLFDGSGVVARSLGFTRVPEALVVDPRDWSAVYRGAIARGSGTLGLADALDAALAGRVVGPSSAPAADVGCPLAGEPRESPTYVKDAAPILLEKCVRCHADLEGPAPLVGYERIRGWSAMIRETLLTQRMPPWSADPRYGTFAGDLSLSTAEMRTLVDWIDAGAPRGEGDDPLATAAPPEAWPLGSPDVALAMDEFAVVPATGEISYRYFPVAGPLEKDLWIRAATIVPGNPRAIHHINLFASMRPMAQFDRNRKSGTMTAVRNHRMRLVFCWVPGVGSTVLPPGIALRVRRGSYLTLEIHYTSVGREQRDRTRVGLYLYRGVKPPVPLKRWRKEKTDLAIPPGDARHEIPAELMFRFPRDAYLVSLRPHMHYRGAGARYTAEYPDGTREILLSVTNYDFNWQFRYEFAPPKRVPAGTAIYVEGAFDNSRSNPANPDPRRRVPWGLATTDEMFLSWLEYYDASPP